jgi:hypothetical protein
VRFEKLQFLMRDDYEKGFFQLRMAFSRLWLPDRLPQNHAKGTGVVIQTFQTVHRQTIEGGSSILAIRQSFTSAAGRSQHVDV